MTTPRTPDPRGAGLIDRAPSEQEQDHIEQAHFRRR